MPGKRPEVLFFDVNETLLSLAPVRAILARLDARAGLGELWFNSLLHYSLVCSAAGRYFGFADLAAATLRMLCRSKAIALDEDTVEEVITSLLNLPAHPEVAQALARLKTTGMPLVALTNSTRDGVGQQIRNAGLDGLFDELLSVEQVRQYKPHLAVYQWAARRLQRDVAQCMMVAAHGWDVAGAQWAGMRTAFVARPGQQPFDLAPPAEIHAADLIRFADEILAMDTS